MVEKTDKKKILVIIPIVNTQFNEGIQKEVEHVLAPDFEAHYANTQQGTCFIESRYAEFLNTKDIISLSQKAEKDGYDGVFVDCFGSPGVSIVRELVSIPVVGGFDGAVLMASLIAQKFSIVTVVPNVVPLIEDEIRTLGITGNVASVRDVQMPVQDLGNKEKLIEHLFEQSKLAVHQDGAAAIVLGCTGMLDVVDAVSQKLTAAKIPAPVVDPSYAAITMLQSLIRCGLSQSRLTYYPPTEKFVTHPSQCQSN